MNDKAPLCKMPMPGNTSCPHAAVYAVTSKYAGGYLHRAVCLVHLMPAIDLDMKTTDGVRVRLVSWLEGTL